MKNVNKFKEYLLNESTQTQTNIDEFKKDLNNDLLPELMNGKSTELYIEIDGSNLTLPVNADTFDNLLEFLSNEVKNQE